MVAVEGDWFPWTPRIKNLKSTTFQGTRCTRRKLAAMQETVQTFPRLSRHELAQTLCMHHRTGGRGGRTAPARGQNRGMG